MKLTTKQVAATKLLKEALSGNREAQHKLSEGISTSDIPVQLTPALSAIALNTFTETVRIWTDFAGREVVPDFESNPYYRFEWADSDIEKATAGITFIEGGLANIPEYDEYPVLRFTASELQISTRKNGVQIKFSWEALYRTRNFNLLRRTFTEFGRRAANQEDIEATKVLVNSSGVNATYWNATNQNILTGNPALSFESLQDAMDAVALQTDSAGVRITPPSKFNLVIPPALRATADGIMAIQQVEVQNTDGTTTTTTTTGNPVSGKINKIVENGWLAKIAGENADTVWFLVPVPGSMPNQAVVNVFLEGEEGPKVFVQRTTNSDPLEGAFIDDSYSTKTRHVVAGAFIDPAGTIASAGK